jgi:hypothetical protein
MHAAAGPLHKTRILTGSWLSCKERLAIIKANKVPENQNIALCKYSKRYGGPQGQGTRHGRQTFCTPLLRSGGPHRHFHRHIECVSKIAPDSRRAPGESEENQGKNTPGTSVVRHWIAKARVHAAPLRSRTEFLA